MILLEDTCPTVAVAAPADILLENRILVLVVV
jgi:hypothetical protein